MCVPVQVIGNVIQAGIKATQIYQERKSVKYQTQIARQNAKAQVDKALLERQKGIEEAKEEKLKSLQELDKKRVKNASSGFDLDDGTHLLQYEDIEDQAKRNTDLIKNEYNLKAKEHLNKSNEYITNANLKIENYNNGLFAKGLSALGEATKVSNNWYIE